MTDHMITAQNSDAVPASKMYLYGGHETNIASLLHALGAYEPHVPEYSSAIISELQQIGDEYYVKVSGLSYIITLSNKTGSIINRISNFAVLILPRHSCDHQGT